MKTIRPLGLPAPLDPGARTVKRGKQRLDVLFLRRDGFGEWTYRTGSL
jgi:hypothetical protein